MASVHSFMGRSMKIEKPLQESIEKNNRIIVIDNGAYECRAGYYGDSQPSLIFKNLILKLKGKKEDNEPDIALVGAEIENIEAVRGQLKSPYDKNVVTQFDVQESVLDYIFINLALGADDHPPSAVLVIEPICNPNHCRKYMSELLFECYNIPRVIYATDGMASWYHNNAESQKIGLIVSCGYQTVHVIPVIEGRIDSANTRRIAVGGYHLEYFMQRLLQLKYPIHLGAITLSRCEEIVQNHTKVSTDYNHDCNQWLDVMFYEKEVRRMQLPYSNVPSNFAAVALQGERQAERARLVKEKQTLEKVNDKKHILDQLIEIGELTGTKLYRRLAELGVDSIGELQCHIKAVKASSEDLKRKLFYKEEFNNGTLTEEWLQKKIDLVDNPDPNCASIAQFDVAEYYQLHIGIEQIRVPELLFQPSMLGISQAGISETLDFVIKKFDQETQNLLAGNVLLTGSVAALPGIRERVERDLTSVRPFKSVVKVKLASSPELDGWKGAADWLKSTDLDSISITQAIYKEKGEQPIYSSAKTKFD